MRNLLPFCLLFILATASSFKNPKHVLGVWSHHPQKKCYSKLKKMPEGYCMVFKEKGKLILRQNSGGCGTPPITYSNVPGTWEWSTDSTITMKYKSWMGPVEEEWVVRSLGKNWLDMKPIAQIK